MKIWVLGAACFLLSAGASAQAPSNPWADFKAPFPGDPEAIGGYGDGCLRGAQKLPDGYPGYQLMRPHRSRFYGHPDLARFLEELGDKSLAEGLGTVLIGDATQPRGGPTLSMHASHQNGLDADIWYWQPPIGKTLTLHEREALSAPNMVVPDFERLTRRWNPRVMKLLRLMARSPLVERVFVNPVIKRQACKTHAGEPWVRKLRPWWGHDDHCHVRLRCPERGSQCRPQEPVPEGDGCGAELAEWFTPEKKAEAREKRLHPKPSPMPVLPPACGELLRQP